MPKYLSLLCLSFIFSSAATAELHDRGNGLIYDDVLNVTWLQDANYAVTSGYDADGKMVLSEAIAWVNGLVYDGISGWRLPKTDQPAVGSSCFAWDGSCDKGTLITRPASELSYMYYVNLLNQAYRDIDGSDNDCRFGRPEPCFSNMSFPNGGDNNDIVSFQNIQTDRNYSYETPSIHSGDLFYGFGFCCGTQDLKRSDGEFNVWPVHDGDVAPPTAIEIFPQGGDIHECTSEITTSVSFDAIISIENGDALDTITWSLDGSIISGIFGEHVEIPLTLGTQGIQATLTTIIGNTVSSSVSVTVEDTSPPDIDARFFSVKTGNEIIYLAGKDRAEVFASAVDLCDPNPAVNMVAGVPVLNGNVIKASTPKKGSSVNVTVEGQSKSVILQVTATDNSGNIGIGEAVLQIAN